MKPGALERLAGVYPIADDDPRWRHDVHAQIELVLASGVSVLQLRIKHRRDREALELCRWAADQAAKAGCLFIVNDRFDWAELSAADGVHLGADDLPPESLPPALRERALVGLSTHTLEQVRASRSRPVDYIGFGPVFKTNSKTSEYAERGLERLAEAVDLADRPVVAIGGIQLDNIGAVRAAGATAAAVISAVANAPDPLDALRELKQVFDSPPGE